MTTTDVPRATDAGAWQVLPALGTVPSAEIVDRAALDRVLVHGSPPGAGRDLDLLVRPESEKAVRDALVAEGFRPSGHRFVRFRQGTCEQVELYPADGWDLPPEELAALFADAVPLEGFDNLVRPSPVHTLLILGRRVVEGVGHLDDKRSTYVDWAVRRDPKVWDHAVDHAEAWHGGRSLELLERLVGHAYVPLPVRARVIDDRLRASGRTAFRAHVETGRQLMPRYPRPVVVSISGLDGSGKSTQARLLVDAFNRIGIDCAVEWAKLGEDRRLWAVRRWMAALLGPAASLRSKPIADDPDPHSKLQEVQEAKAPSHPEATSGEGIQALRTSSPSRSLAWAAVVLFSNIWTYRRQVTRYRGRARFLVYDRYVLDSAVHLRWRYGTNGRAADVLTRVLVRLAPPTVRSFYLSMPPDRALLRKMEDPIEDLVAHAELYGDVLDGPAGRDVITLDGSRPIEALAATIANSVWDALEEQSDARRAGWRRILTGG